MNPCRNRIAVNGLARRYQSSLSQSTVEVNGYKVSGLPTLTVSPSEVKSFILKGRGKILIESYL